MVGEKMTFKEEIEKLLKDEVEALQELKDIAFEKTDIIIQNDIQELQLITKREEELANDINKLERQRQNLFHIWGLAKDTPISSVIENLPDDPTILIHIRENMTKLIEEVDIRNKLNNDLIRENLDWVDFNMNLITSMSSSPSYNDKENKSLNIFDKKV